MSDPDSAFATDGVDWSYSDFMAAKDALRRLTRNDVYASALLRGFSMELSVPASRQVRSLDVLLLAVAFSHAVSRLRPSLDAAVRTLRSS